MLCRWILLLLLTSWDGQAKPLVIAAPPYVITLVTPLYQHWFSQAGLEVTFLPCGWARCRELSLQGVADGEALRIWEHGETNRHLVRVDVPLTKTAYYGLSLDPLAANQSLQQLIEANKQFGCLRGNAWCEQTIPPSRRTHLNSPTQGIPLLLRHRIDILVVVDWHTPSFLPNMVEGHAVISTLLFKGNHYLFLTSQHTAEAKKLQQAWSELVHSPSWPSLSAQFTQGQKAIIEGQYHPQ